MRSRTWGGSGVSPKAHVTRVTKGKIRVWNPSGWTHARARAPGSLRSSDLTQVLAAGSVPGPGLSRTDGWVAAEARSVWEQLWGRGRRLTCVPRATS